MQKRGKDRTKQVRLFLAAILLLGLVGMLYAPYKSILSSANIAGFGIGIGDVSVAIPLPQSQELQKIGTINNEIVQKNRQIATKTGTAKSTAINELRQTLVERKQNLELLIEKNPKEALAAIMPKSLAEQLPAEVKDLVEKPVLLIGDLEVLHIDDFENKDSIFRYTLNIGTEILKFYPAGEEFAAVSAY